MLSEKRRAQIETQRRALRLKPWEIAPSQIRIGEQCPYTTEIMRASWRRASDLRQQLADATRAARRARRTP
jgi:hypothetical protein